jgi:hypothetical protein
MAEDEPGGLLGAVIARDAAQVLRLSALYALTDTASSIEVCHLEAAWAVWQYCRQSVQTIFGDASGNPTADKLHRALLDAGEEGLDGRQMDRAFGGHVSAGELKAALESLKRRELVLTYSEETGGRPRTITVARLSADKAEDADKGPRR